VWWVTFGQSIHWGLVSLYHAFNGVPILATVGAYGLAVVVLTVTIKLVLSPLYQLQIRLSRRAMDQQRKVAPDVAELRKKYKGEKLNQEMMKLYKEHGVNPLGGAAGCLPAVVQMPILIALYYVFYGAANTHEFPLAHFLFVPNLNDIPSRHALLHGLPIPTIAYAIIPLLAAATTFVQSKMIQQPPNPAATEQEQTQQQMAKSMQVMMPLVIAYFAIVTPAGLGLYWFVSNCFAIVQQYFVTGWGSLSRRPPSDEAGSRNDKPKAPAAGPGKKDSRPSPQAGRVKKPRK
jgi:YidC/Oxa1 family membrane protein insertase